VYLNSPFSSNGIVHEGQKDFDQEYKSIEIVDRVKKIGEGENDFVVYKDVVVSWKPIQEVIDADKDNVGVENIIKQVLRTGDTSLLPVDKGDCNVDLVGAPESLMELKQMGVQAQAKFEALPDELTKGMDMASFVNNMNQEQFDAFIAAVAARASGKEEDK
jgi:hypothetical protein